MLNEATPRNFVRDQSLHIEDTQFNEAILAGYRFIFNRLRPDCSTPGTLPNKKKAAPFPVRLSNFCGKQRLGCQRILRLFDDHAKRFRLVYGQIGQNLAVHFDTGQ